MVLLLLTIEGSIGCVFVSACEQADSLFVLMAFAVKPLQSCARGIRGSAAGQRQRQQLPQACVSWKIVQAHIRHIVGEQGLANSCKLIGKQYEILNRGGP